MAAKSIEELRTSQQKMSEELSSRIDGFNSRIEEMHVHVDTSIEKVENQVSKFADEMSSLKQLIKQLIDKDSKKPEYTMGTSSAALGDGLLPTPPRYESPEVNLRNVDQYKIPKIDFPLFNGDAPMEWIRRSERYFQIHDIPESHKVGYAELFLRGAADVWFGGLRASFPNLSWQKMREEILKSFGCKSMDMAVDEFHQLKQVGYVDEYLAEPILTDSNSFPGIQLIKKAEELFPSKIEVVKVAYQVFDEMTSPVPAVVHSFSTGSLFGDEGKDDSSPIKVDNQLVVELEQLHPLKFESLRDTRQLFDKMTGPISIKHNDENDSHENLVLPTIDLLKILSYGEAAPEFHSLKLEGLKNARHVFDKMPSNLNVELWVVKVLMVVFDPGGSSWLHNGCDAFELINGCDQSSGIKAGSVLSLMSEKRASTKFLRCVEWSDVQEVKQALELMGKWVPIDVCDALELLSPVFESEEVRAYAVSVLERADDEELQCYLLQLDNFDEPIRSPLVPSVLISGIIPSESSIFKSALHPLRLVFRTANGGNCKIIFKKGDDLRQDQLVIQMVTLMDRLLKLENLDLHLTPYEKQNIGYSLVIQVQNFGAEIFSCSSHMLLILFLDGLTNGLDLVSSSGTWLCLLFPLCANFVWDPGLCVGHFRLHPWGQGCF